MESLQDYLRQELTARSRKNARYSLRAFARALNMDSSSLSALLAERRPLTPRTAQKILNELEIEPALRKRLLLSSLVPPQPLSSRTRPGTRPTASTPRQEISSDALEMIESWEHYAILALLRTKARPKSDASRISRKLGLTTGATLQALKTLERLALIRKDGSGWVRIAGSLTTSHDVPSASLRRSHRKFIEKAIESLEAHTVDERDITGTTLLVSPAKLAEAKKRIQKFRRSLSKFLEEGEDGDVVFRLNIQLFPLSR